MAERLNKCRLTTNIKPLTDTHMGKVSWSFSMFNDFRWEIFVGFCYIGGIVDHHRLHFLFMVKIINTMKTFVVQNQIWVPKNSNYLLDYIQSGSFSSCNNINIFDLSTLYTSISHSKRQIKISRRIEFH